MTQPILFPASTEWGEKHQNEWLNLIRSGRKTLIVLPVEPQPRAMSDLRGGGRQDEWTWRGIHWRGAESNMMPEWCPYPVGSVLAVTCPFRVVYDVRRHQSTWTCDGCWSHWFTTHGRSNRLSDGSHSADDMPGWLQQEFRLPRLTVKSVECRRVNTITEDEAKATGATESLVAPGDRGSYVASFAYNHWFRTHGEKCPFETAWAWMIGGEG